MIIAKLALKNLLGAGLRTWLIVSVLSLSFVLIIFSQGLLEGMNRQAEEAMIASEIGGGHFQHPAYDAYDPLTLSDARGACDARGAVIAQVMKTSVQSIDQGQIWVPLARLRDMTGLPGEATFVVLAQDAPPVDEAKAGGWRFRGRDDLLADIWAMVESKSVGSSILYAIFLALAMLAMFDTQVLAIFHRRREMGTLMALGFTRGGVIGLFTVEGMLNGVLAALVAAVYGIPLLSWVARTGWALPGDTDS